MVDAHVMKLRDIQHIVGRMAISVNHAVRPYFSPDNRQESFFCGVCGRQRIHFTAALEQPKHGNFSGSPATSRALAHARSEEHTSELQSQSNLVCRLLLEKKKK